MYSHLPSFVLGFHGCCQTVAEEVFSGKTPLEKSTNAYDWLGNGIYFWENNPQRALDWAKHLKNHPNPNFKGKPVKEPAVVGAIIDLGHCLNLLDAKYIQMVKRANALYERICELDGRSLAQNKTAENSKDLLLRYRDCAVIESLHESRKQKKLPDFSSVRGMFTEGEPLYTGAGFHEKSHIQICVRNPNCIKGYFRILEPLDDWPLP